MKKILLLSALALATAIPTLRAATATYSTDANGTFSGAGWTPANPATSGDDVVINPANAVSRTMTVDSAWSAAGSVNSLTLGASVAGNINMAGSGLTSFSIGAGGIASGSGTGTLTFLGTIPVLSLSADQAWSGGRAISVSTVLGGTGNLNITSTQSVSFGGGASAYSGNITATAGTLVYGSSSSSALGTGNLILAGSAFRSNDATAKTISNNVSMTGNTTFGSSGSSYGALTFAGSTWDLGSSSATRKITINKTSTVGNNNVLTIQNALTGSNNLELVAPSNNAGSSTVVLEGVNTYTGTTAIGGGGFALTVLVDGSLSSSSVVTVYGNATLGGTGTIGGNTTMNSSSKLSAGNNSADTLTFTNNLAINSPASSNDGAFVFTLGTAFDQIVVGGTLTIGSNLLNAADFSFSTGAGFGVSQSYTLFDATVLAGSFTTFAVTDIGGSGIDGNVLISGSDIILQTVPEPATWALLAGSLTALVVFRRRRS